MTPEANWNNVANPIIFTVGGILNPAGPQVPFYPLPSARAATPRPWRPSRPLRPCCRRRRPSCRHCRGAAQRLDEGRGAGSAGHGTRHSKDSTHTELWQRCTRTWHLVPRHRISHSMRFRSIKRVSEIELDERLEQIDAGNWWRRSVSIGLKKATLFHLQRGFPRGFADDSSSQRCGFNGSDQQKSSRIWI